MQAPSLLQPATTQDLAPHWRRDLRRAFAVAVAYFCLTLPFLSWVPITGGMEGNVIVAAREAVRDGHWFPGTQNGAPRLRKPPLAHWTTAAGMLAARGYSLATAARWPTLAAASAALGVTILLGSLVVGGDGGLWAALIAGSSAFFLIHARQASYDTQLTFWVTLTNFFLVVALFRGRKAALIPAGAALGLAVMVKGPVAIVMTVVPALVYAAMRRWRRWDDGAVNPPMLQPHTVSAYSRGHWLAVIVGGSLVFLLIVLPWPLLVARRYPGMFDFWFGQVTLRGARVQGYTRHWFPYFNAFPLLWPWIVWVVLGTIAALRDQTPAAKRTLAMVIWVVVPVGIMSLFPAHRSRYVLPLIAPAAVVAAYGLRTLVSMPASVGKAVLAMHWFGIAVPMIIGAIGCASGRGPFQAVDGGPSLSAIAAGASIAAIISIVWIAALRPPTPRTVLAGSVACVIVAYPLTLSAYAKMPSGTPAAAPFITSVTTAHPDAVYYSTRPRFRDPPLVMVIYADRVLWHISDPAALQPANREQVLIRLEPRDGPSLPPPFRLIKRQAIGSEVWGAYFVPATPSAPPPVVPPPLADPSNERFLWR